MIHISEAINDALARLEAQFRARASGDNVVPFPLTPEMRIRLAIRRQVQREREAR